VISLAQERGRGREPGDILLAMVVFLAIWFAISVLSGFIVGSWWYSLSLFVAGCVAGLAITFWGTHVLLTRMRNDLEEAASFIDVDLQQRYDFIENAAIVVRKYAEHERGVFEEVAKSRSAWQKGSRNGRDLATTQALQAIYAVAERYPALRADRNFRELQGDLRETENRVADARRNYNALVRKYNGFVQTWPDSLLALIQGFRSAEYLTAEAGAEQKLRVQL
jgi:LemA protein